MNIMRARILNVSIDVNSNCPPSNSISKIYSSLVSQITIQNTENLHPLVAVQPVWRGSASPPFSPTAPVVKSCSNR